MHETIMTAYFWPYDFEFNKGTGETSSNFAVIFFVGLNANTANAATYLH